MIAQKLSYDSKAENNGLISLSGEERKMLSFEFDEEGTDVRIDYSDSVPEEEESEDKPEKAYEPCTHWVNKVCELYNRFINVPILNVIFYFVHRIIHVFKG